MSTRTGKLTIASPLVKQKTKWEVFVAWTTEELADRRDTLMVMLEKAGMEVYPKGPQPTDESEALRLIEDCVNRADASIHVLGATYGKSLITDKRFSLPRLQYLKAEDKGRANPGKFKRFVWHLIDEGQMVLQDQMEFINLVQNSLSDDMMFTVTQNAPQFVDEIKSFLNSDASARDAVKEFDIAFLSNVADAADCYEVIEKLSAEYKVTTLTVVPDKDVDYKAQAIEQVRKSRMTIVYFKETSDWAISFTKMVWKLSGGASSGSPFLLIGEDEPRRNRFLKFTGPNIQLAVVHKAEVYDRILYYYDKVKQTRKINDDVFCPYTGLRPFNENESIFFKGRESHINTITKYLEVEKFSMVTGSSGDGKSSLIFAGVIPSMKAGFMKALYSKWAVADFRPERQPMRNMSVAIARELRYKSVEEVENQLSFGFSALIDLYKNSPLYCDITSDKYLDATDAEQKEMKRQCCNLLILVDQFEEFFTNAENYREGVASPIAQITINVLLETIRIARDQGLPIYVIFTMRSDYIGQCVAFRGFPELIGLSTYFVPRLKREEIQEVIQAPAVLNGNRISSRLVQRLLNDLGDGLDQLPVLQHTLQQIWTTAGQARSEMDLIHYSVVGGLAANKLPDDSRTEFERWFAQQPEYKKKLYDRPKLRNVLNRHANELYETAHETYNELYQPTLSKEKAQQIIQVAFTALTKIDDNRAVRNRVSLQQIANVVNDPEVSPQVVSRLLNIYRKAGNTLIQPYITDDPSTHDLPPGAVLDITHEALIRNWDKLVEWALHENKNVATYIEFKYQVNRWIENGMSSKDLLNIGTYTYFNTWYQQANPNAAWIRRYLRPDELVPDMDINEQSEQYLEDIDEYLALSRQRIERNRRRVAFAIGLISVLFLFSLVLAIIAQQKATEAERQGQIAIGNAKKAELQRVRAEKEAAEANRQRTIADQQRLLAERKTLEAELERTRAEDEAKRAELQRQIAEKNRQLAENQKKLAEENRLIADAKRKEAELQKQLAEQASEQARRSEAEAVRQKAEALQQRNKALITQSYFLASLAEEQVDQNNPEVGLLLALKGLPREIGDPNDRPYVAQTEASLYYAANALVNAKPFRVLEGHKNKMIFNQFSPDGSKLITTSWDKTARLWDVNTGKEIGSLTGHTHIVSEAYFSPDGKYIVSLGQDFSARIWDFSAQRTIGVFRGHRTTLTHAAITTDNKRVVTTSEDKTAILWDLATERKIAVLTGHTGSVLFAAFSPDGKRIVTTSADNMARLWDGEKGTLIEELKAHSDAVTYAAFSPDGRTIGTVSSDYYAYLWDAQTGKQTGTLKGHNGGIKHIEFSADGNRIITASQDATAKVWDASSGKLLGSLNGHTQTVYHAAFSKDGKHIVTTAQDKTARVWDGVSYLRLAVYSGHPNLNYRAVFNPAGTMLAMAGPQFTVHLFKVMPNQQELLDLVYNQLRKRDLTPLELSKFFLETGEIRKEIQDELIRKQKERGETPIPVTPSPTGTGGKKTGGTTTPTSPRTEDTAITLKPSQPKNTPVAPSEEPKPAAQPSARKPEPERYTPPAEATPSRPTQKPEPPRYVPPAEPRTHIVRPGETLFNIAKQHKVPVERIMELNNISGGVVRPGTKLRLE
jgi:WD40 repeat protein/LysM repeat protein